MKTLMCLIALFLSFSSYSQTSCKPYVPAKEGTKWEITNYKQNGKETGKVVYELLQKDEMVGGARYVIKTTTYDDKGKELFTHQFNAMCRGGKFEFDMAYMMDGGALQAYQGMEMEVDASALELPSMNAATGSTLKDATMQVKVGSGGMSLFNMNVEVINRKVAGKETITTPAGTFECLKLSQDVKTKMIVNIEASSVDWYAEEIGMIRSESYNKNGKLQGYSELTMVKEP